jgi:hypothetical protein
MPKRRKIAKRGANTGRPVLNVSGTLQSWGIPVPKLPFLIGSATNLTPKQSIYPSVSFSIPITPQKVSLVAGAAASAINIDETLIPNFSTRFAGTFREAAVVGCRLEARVTNVVNPAGIAVIFFNEKVFASPTDAEQKDTPHVEVMISATESPSRHMLDWLPQDYLDLQWSNISSLGTPVAVKVYASVAGTYTTNTTTADVILTGAMQFAFRGWI